MKKVVSGLAATLVLSLSVLAVQPAAAQWDGYGPRGDWHHDERMRDDWRRDEGRRSHWRDDRPHGFYGYGGRPHCFVRMERYWDGWGWARQPRRICR